MSQQPEHTPAPIPPVSVPVPTVPARSSRRTAPPDAAPPPPPRGDVPANYGPPSPAGGGTVTAITILSLILAVVAGFGMLGGFLSAVFDGGPMSEAGDGWTPAHEQFLDFPVFGSPLVTIGAITGAILTRRSRGWWALWLAAGYVLVILFIVIGAVAMRGAPPWQ